MKSRLFILLLLAAGATTAEAQSMLKVRLTDNSRINISVDGRYFSKKGTTVTVGELPPGRHRLEIYSVQQTRSGRGREEVVYSGKVITHPGNITLFTYDPDGRQIDVQEQDIHNYSQSTPPINNGVGTYENNMPGQVNNNNNDNGNDNRYVQSPAPYPRTSRAAATLTDVKIVQLKSRASDKKTDTEKMNLIKDGLGGEKMTTDQVNAIMDFFNFEDSKVQFAKWAYPNTVDKENFAALESKLSYQNYVDDLDKFIKENNK